MMSSGAVDWNFKLFGFYTMEPISLAARGGFGMEAFKDEQLPSDYSPKT